ncbi:hypothetical protein [Pseudomonas sp. NPDC079086]|uniref:hypothetical protein n=1 Tax=unclassified Pseudomonas TaxID=196821 RepID=UPI0037C71A2C
MAEMQGSPDSCPKCQVVYSKAGQNKASSAALTSARSSAGMLKKAVIVCVFILALVGGWKFYEHRQAVAAVEEQVQLTSVYVTQIITALDDSGSMTFAEFFEKANKAVVEIDSSVVKVSLVSAAPDVSSAAVTYMKKSQEVIRALSGSMRNMMKLSSAKDREKSAEADEYSSNKYIQERAAKNRLEALNDQLELIGEMKSYRENLLKLLADMRAAGESIPSVNSAVLVAPPLYERLSNAK